MGTITTLDMRTGGEPVRVVTGGYPPIPKRTILDRAVEILGIYLQNAVHLGEVKANTSTDVRKCMGGKAVNHPSGPGVPLGHRRPRFRNRRTG